MIVAQTAGCLNQRFLDDIRRAGSTLQAMVHAKLDHPLKSVRVVAHQFGKRVGVPFRRA